MTTIPMFYDSDNGELLPVPSFSERIRRVIHEGAERFVLTDLMSEFSDLESRPDILWKRTRERLEKDGFELDQKVIKLSVVAKNGKRYKMDCADGETCLRIIQSIPSVKAEPVRQWFATLGYQRLQEMADPELGIKRAYQRAKRIYERDGKSDTWVVDRFKTIDDFKLLCSAIDKVCVNPQYGVIVNSEYVALFGMVASKLKELLNARSIRDSLPELQLATLHTAEVGLRLLLEHSDVMTTNAICEAARTICEPLAESLLTISRAIGVHPITGQPLLEGGN